jgi:type I restriction enzyme S subunit
MSEKDQTTSLDEYQRFLNSLPTDWDRKEIRQLGTVVGGSTPSRDVPSFWQGSVPWVTPGEVSGNTRKVIYDTIEHISPSGLAGSGE